MTAQLNLEDIMLSTSNTQKGECHMMTIVCRIQKRTQRREQNDDYQRPEWEWGLIRC